MSGVFYIGLGDQYDADKLQAIPTGTVVVRRVLARLGLAFALCDETKSDRVGRLTVSEKTRCI